MDDRDFMDMMYQGFTKTTRAEDAYWGFEEDIEQGVVQRKVYNLFYVAADAPDEKVSIGTLDSEADAAFVTAIAGAFPDIHRRWLQALDEAEQKDLEKDLAESVAADLSERLGRYEAQYGVEDWHGKATTGG
jgi:hypothetical protein